MLEQSTVSARDFAIQKHKAAKALRYREFFRIHIDAVVQILREFGYTGAWSDVGYLQHTLEDTLTTGAELQKLFGTWVRRTVESCTGMGENRQERNIYLYRRIQLFPEGAIPLTVDRIVKLEEYPIRLRHVQLYLEEQEEFCKAVACRVPIRMQQRLDKAYQNRLRFRQRGPKRINRHGK